MLLLTLAGVQPDGVVDDYELTAERVRLPAARKLGRDDDSNAIAAVLDRHGTTSRAVIVDILASLDIAAHLGAAGLSVDDCAAVRRRLRP